MPPEERTDRRRKAARRYDDRAPARQFMIDGSARVPRVADCRDPWHRFNRLLARDDLRRLVSHSQRFSPPMTKAPADDWIELSADALDVARAVAFVQVPAAGGIDLFLGTTRAEAHADGRPLLALDYEAYPAMALKRLGELAAEARRRWPVCRLVVLHRTGRVPVAEPSVAIAVSTPHRAASFEACRFLIDALKVDVPIWKQEVWADGAGTWVHPAGEGRSGGVVG